MFPFTRPLYHFAFLCHVQLDTNTTLASFKIPQNTYHPLQRLSSYFLNVLACSYRHFHAFFNSAAKYFAASNTFQLTFYSHVIAILI
ncbi:hypothetical protein CW304_01520 [Bacillus sp. UFRGS-B20]|nr:hypothetical protein CW304_01520 [Bacillus sp. UFRGS-B20]